MAWPGGKDGAGVYQRLINQIPPHDLFVSAFLGDCAVMRRKAPAAVSVGIDRSRENVERWAREQPLPGLSLYCCCGIEWLRHHFGLYQVTVGTAAASGDGTRWPSPPDVAAARATQLPAAEACHSADAAESSGGIPRTFVYVDPPYLLETRRSRRALYDFELTVADHVELLDTLQQLPCMVMVSHYPHRLYAQALARWRTFSFEAITRGGRMAREQVWCNYPEPAELHDARYVGGDKRERERVRRRVRNWVDGLGRMLPAERQAVLDAIEGRGFLRPPRQPAPPA